MIDAPLAESFVHRPHTVMARRLRPLSLRRLFALMIIDSPFLDNSRGVTWSDLEAAVTVCALRNPVPVLWCLPRHRRLRGRLLRRLRSGTLERHALRFVAYLKDYHALPESADEEGGTLAKAPWLLRIVHTLTRNGFSEEEYKPCWPFRNPLCVWDLPTGEAFFRYATVQELDGAEINVLDPEEKELLELARQSAPAPTLTPEVKHG